jgi:hypothetical protein
MRRGGAKASAHRAPIFLKMKNDFLLFPATGKSPLI